MKEISKIKVIIRKSHNIKPDVLRDYSLLSLVAFKSRTKFYVSEEWAPKSLIEFLDSILEFSHVDEYGDKITYTLKKEGRELGNYTTLRDAGIREGDIIKIVPVPRVDERELEIVEISDMVQPAIAQRPPDEILEQFNKICNKEITESVEREKTEKHEKTENEKI